MCGLHAGCRCPLCQEIETSKLVKPGSEEVDVAIEIFRRLNSGGAS